MVYKMYKIEHILYKLKLLPFAFVIRLMMRVIFSCDIPYKAVIGDNTSFPHYALGVLIHPKVIIGDNCKILHNVTIGGRSGNHNLPIIGNNVLIGTGAIIIGDVKVGDNSIIGAGSVVVKDVPENSVVCGNPAKIIKRNVNQ